MNDDLALSTLDALAHLPCAALRLGTCLVLGGMVCLVVLLGSVAANPAAVLLPTVSASRSPTQPVAAPSIAIPVSAGALALGLAAVQEARLQIGKPYIWGAAGPDSFDCSGLVEWAWAQVGVRIPKFTVDQYYALEPVPVEQLQPGDLVYLQNTYPADYRITHVGMVTERGTVIEAPAPGLSVREVPLASYIATHYFGAGRPRPGGT